MKQKPYQFMVLYHEKIQQENKTDQIKTSIIVDLKTILATDEKVALLQIAKTIPDKYNDQLQDVEIVMRPF